MKVLHAKKVCEQARDDIKVKVSIQSPILHLSHTVKDVGINTLSTYHHFSIIPTLFAYFLACYPYIFNVSLSFFLFFFDVTLNEVQCPAINSKHSHACRVNGHVVHLVE